MPHIGEGNNMKTRNGFVSNSSSSSFIVKVYYSSVDALLEGKPEEANSMLITKEQLQVLKDLDFRYTNVRSTEHIEFIPNWTKVSRERRRATVRYKDHAGETQTRSNHEYMCKSVICNQDNILYPLLRYKIPFEALFHYGHESVFYNGGDEFITIPNHGIQFCPRLAEAYKDDDNLEFNKPSKSGKTTKITDYLQDEERYNED
jgi:hypothetical protein